MMSHFSFFKWRPSAISGVRRCHQSKHCSGPRAKAEGPPRHIWWQPLRRSRVGRLFHFSKPGESACEVILPTLPSCSKCQVSRFAPIASRTEPSAKQASLMVVIHLRLGRSSAAPAPIGPLRAILLPWGRSVAVDAGIALASPLTIVAEPVRQIGVGSIWTPGPARTLLQRDVVPTFVDARPETPQGISSVCLIGHESSRGISGCSRQDKNENSVFIFWVSFLRNVEREETTGHITFAARGVVC